MAIGNSRDSPGGLLLMHATDSVLGDFHIRSTSAADWSRTATTLATQIEEPWRSELREEALSAGTLAVNKGNHFLQANRLGKTVGVARGNRLPGRMALIRTVTLLKSEPDEIARQMIQTLDRQLMPEPDSFSMVSLRNPSITQASWFESCGYTLLSQVDTVCLPLAKPVTAPCSSPLQFIAGAEHHRKELVCIVQATYQASLDCPKLQQFRSIDDILDSYEHQGIAPAGWSFVQYKGKTIGCLLMSAFPRQPTWELTYLGLVPEARGQGWGNQIVQHGCFLASQHGADLVIASVDQANQPALNIYHQRGFIPVDQAHIYGKSSNTSATRNPR
jgi:ribosomal protein S18 acetylase RimI-like enzyme